MQRRAVATKRLRQKRAGISRDSWTVTTVGTPETSAGMVDWRKCACTTSGRFNRTMIPVTRSLTSERRVLNIVLLPDQPIRIGVALMPATLFRCSMSCLTKSTTLVGTRCNTLIIYSRLPELPARFVFQSFDSRPGPFTPPRCASRLCGIIVSDISPTCRLRDE